MLGDLLPHAHSIFRIFTLGSILQIEELKEDATSEKGCIYFRDDHGARFELYCDKQASFRQRYLEISTSTMNASVDFQTEVPKVMIDGYEQTNQDTIHMNSTLRLAFGALLLERSGLVNPTPISVYLDELSKLHSYVEKNCAV